MFTKVIVKNEIEISKTLTLRVGEIYFSKRDYNKGTYTIFYDIYDLNNNQLTSIGALYPHIFEDLNERRKRLIKKLVF